MQLESIAANIRARTPWEAIDLGFAMVREWWLLIYTPLALMLLCILSLLLVAIPYEHYWVTLLLLWWLKPLYHRLILHVISRKLFGDTVEYGSALKELPRLLTKTGLFSELTWRRFSMSRGFLLPIWQLEQLRGKQRKQRQQLLLSSVHTVAIWLNIAIFSFQFILTTSFFMLIWLFIPAEISEDLMYRIFSNRLDSIGYTIEIIAVTGFVSVMVFLEPFYIAASFAMYINRRTQLEAWDIEINFRKMSKRLSLLDKSLLNKKLSTIAAIVLASALGLATLQQPSYADEVTPDPVTTTEILSDTRLDADQSQRVVKEVMQHPDLSFEKLKTTWRYKGDIDSTENKENPAPDWLIALGIMIASLLEYTLWILVGAAIIALYVFRKHWLPLLVRLPDEEVPERPDILFGMDVRKESLPSDIPSAAKVLWAEGKHREALSVLYRGALVTLINDDKLALEHNHTEGDILSLSRPALPTPRYQYLADLTRHWVAIAYAHKTPGDEDMDSLLSHWASDFAVTVEVEQ